MTLLVISSLPFALIPPPPLPLTSFPWVIIKFFIATVTLEAISKTVLALFPLTLIFDASEEPSIVTSLLIMSVDESTMVCPDKDESKLIVPPEQISAIAWRKDPTPE